MLENDDNLSQFFEPSEIKKLPHSGDSDIKIPDINIVKSPPQEDFQSFQTKQIDSENYESSYLSPRQKKIPFSPTSKTKRKNNFESVLSVSAEKKLKNYFHFKEKFNNELKDISIKDQFELLDYVSREESIKFKIHDKNFMEINRKETNRKRSSYRDFANDEYKFSERNSQEDYYSFKGNKKKISSERKFSDGFLFNNEVDKIEIVSETKIGKNVKIIGGFRGKFLERIKGLDEELGNKFHDKLINGMNN